ncbi:unnamed protein product, partial [Didymodactylos carnosus]
IGWIIFAICIIPIPIVFIVNYIKEYRKLTRETISAPINHRTHNHLVTGQNYVERPRYLEAFTRNNEPADDWGPKRDADHIGPYAHLSKRLQPMTIYPVTTEKGLTNSTFEANSPPALAFQPSDGIVNPSYQINGDDFRNERF